MNAESGFAARAVFLPSFPIDLELLVAVAFVLLAALALVYAIFASYLYFRFERNNADRHVPVAIGLFGLHYFVFFGSRHLRGEFLLPMLLLVLTAMILVLVIWLGSQARSKPGARIAWAGVSALGAFVCLNGYDIYRSMRFVTN